ncbi:NAD-dependent succinate-semialdehyde dehydrogenase [Taibaiella lutea]|uniref:NAD-dependent succinate-semialdehyde dehydrogenase n=1 Tax=Taibaiella lutea TaxID=2608001 RepID=A0A5M6CR61_9BACT|nr:NAD-dependent succinate-semialdehyde dehydrogenase [Taibaiella lutea]KAA5536870.1 NAD-dependent succinate-semialdehyde dehydrogenase [Taibaiella lutea]
MTNTISSINPYNGKEIKQYNIDTKTIIKFKLENAHKAFEKWSKVSVRQRAAYLKALGDYLQKNKKSLAEMATIEMGKPYIQSVTELEKSATTLHYYADKGPGFLEREMVETEAQKSFVSFQPLGTVLAIMPWNFPYWQVFRALGPILMAGNSMVLKHASNVTGCALAIENIIKEAGLPEYLFQTIIVPSSEMEEVIAHRLINAVTFTGSTSGGSKVAELAGKHLKKQVLELGGSDAYVVLEDADLKNAVEVCVTSRLNNSGQSCISAKRFVVDKKVIGTFQTQMVALMEQRKYGDPMNTSTTVGPLARHDLRDQLHQQVMDSVSKGAKILCGGFIPEEEGAFYPPTVLTNVKKGMPAYDEELFGPVAAIIEAQDEADAIRIANDSVFGLGGAIFSRDIKRAESIAEEQLQAGSIFVNDFVRSDARLPFGGIKQSGYGRELSYYGLREFVNIKTIFVR